MVKAKKVLTIRQERNRALRQIKWVLDMVMWESGYRTGQEPNTGPDTRRALRLWAPRETRRNEKTNRKIRIGGFLIGEVEGFTEDGVILDSTGGGLAVTHWEDIPVEDLLKIERYCYKIKIGFSL